MKARILALLALPAFACSGGDQVPANKKPTVTVTITPERPTTVDDLTANAVGMDAEGADVELDYTWRKNGTRIDVDGPTLSANQTERGDLYEVTVVGSDGRLESDEVKAEVRIENAVPSLDSVTIGPEPAIATTELTATPGTTNDEDDDEVTVTYVWMADGTMVGEGLTLAAGTARKGQSISVVATPNDGIADGEPQTSNTVVLMNSAPSITGVSILPANGGAADEFVCTPAGWMDIDGDAPGYEFSWTINGADAGVATATITSGYVRDDVLTCTVTPNDGEATGPSMTSAPVTVANSPPTVMRVTIAPTDPREGDTVSAMIEGGMDPDGDNVAYNYQWRVATRVVSIQPTIASDLFDKGETIRLTITPTDGTDNGPIVRSNTATVANSPPAAVSAQIQPDPATSSAPLVAVVNGWTDPDPADGPNYEYQWFVNGALVPGAVMITLDAVEFSRDDMVYFVATPFDGTDRGPPVASSTVTIGNGAPNAPTVTVAPAMPRHDDDLVCTIGTPSVDPDGDNVTYTYVWRRNGVVVTAVTSSTAPAAQTRDRDVWSCEVTPSDGVLDGPSATAETTVAPACDSVALDGVDDYVSTPASAVLATAATVEAWVQWNGTALNQVSSQIYGHAPASQAMQLGVFGSDTTTGTLCPGRAAGQPYFAWTTAAGGCLNATAPMVANTWHHVAGVHAGGVARLFVNGELVAESTTPPAIAAGRGTLPIGIGGFAGGAAGGFFGGSIAEVRVSSTARYTAAFTPQRRLAADTDTLASWRLDEGAGGTSVIERLNGTATLQGGATWDTDGPICEFDPLGITEIVANHICEFTTRCEPAIYGFFGWDDAICLANRNALLGPQYAATARMIANGRANFSEAQLTACLNAYRNVDCETQFDAGVCDFFLGQQQVGQACSSSIECGANAYCNSGTTLACGSCQLRAADGTSCATAPCIAGSQCLNVGAQQLCINFRNAIGQGCGTVATGLCRGRLQCVLAGAVAPGTCQRSAPPNGACSTNNQGGVPACNIYENQTCNNGTCAPVTWTAVGNACNVTNQCDSQGTCNGTSCVAWPAAGTACNGGNCNDAAFCNAQNQCVARLAAGGVCTQSAECQDGLVCQAGTCGVFDWGLCP